jgi:hypothetical protein
MTPRTDAPQQQRYTPSMQQHDSMPLSTLSTERHGGTSAAGVSLMEVSTFMTEQLKAVARMEARMDKQALEAKAEMEAQRLESRKQASEAKAEMEAQRLENDKLRTEAAEATVRAEMQAKVDGASAAKAAADTRVEAAAARLRDQQLIALQARLEALSAGKLLTDDELFAVEDVIADSSVEASGDDQVAMLLALSARMASDSAFARQLRRKVVAQ